MDLRNVDQFKKHLLNTNTKIVIDVSWVDTIEMLSCFNNLGVRLGEKELFGCLMPHEEVLTLGTPFDMEVGFLYCVNETTTKLIRDHIDNVESFWDWKQRVLVPSEGEVEGEDLVGVLLVYDDHETYIYNKMKSKDIFPKYKTNANLLSSCVRSLCRSGKFIT